MNCNNSALPFLKLTSCPHDPVIKRDYSFKDGKMYENGIYQGDIIAITKTGINVKYVSKNKYINGQIAEISIYFQK